MSSRACEVLVTGANGFLGVAVVERLLARGKPGIRCLVRAGSNRRRLDAVLARYPGADVEIVSGGLSTPAAAAKLVEAAPLVLHLAASLSGPAADIFLGTVVASKHLLMAIASSPRKPRVLLVSSFGVYGVADRPRGELVDETTPLEAHPERRDNYSHAKLRQEQLFFEYRARHDLALCVLRPGAIYGPGGGAFSGRVGIALPGVFLFLGRGNLLPLSYVDNCAEAICVAAERARFDGDVYNVHDDDLITCDEYLRRYRAAVGPIRVVRSPYFATMLLSRTVEWYHRHSRGQLPPIFTPYKTRTTWKGNRFSNARIRALGFSPVISTEEGLRRTFEYLRETRAPPPAPR
jgi:nucleoside-diphosphate-sugar epimerase